MILKIIKERKMIVHLEDSVYKKLQDEAIEYLLKYIQIDTSEKTGDMDSGVEFIESIIKNEGIEYTIIKSDKGKKSILAHLPGEEENEKSLVLLNHMDVVPANAEEWKFEPYGGKIIDNYITGRGSIDMKSLGIAELISFIYIKRSQIKLKRDIYFLAVSDEEMGGIEGTKYVVEHFLDKIKPQAVLDEGGWGSERLGKRGTIFIAAIGQKRGVFLRLTVRGKGGHAAQPCKNNTNDILVQSLSKLSKTQFPICKNKQMWKNIRLLLREINYFDYFLSLNYRLPGVKTLLARRLRRDNFLNAMIRNTITTTVIRSGKENNVIPATAEAVLDCRVMKEVSTPELIAWVKKIVNNDCVEVSVIKELKECNVSPDETEFMKVIDQVIKSNYNNACVVPYITPLGTDAKYFREYGVEGVGLFPGILEEEDLKTMHGLNEKLNLDVFKKVCKCTLEIALNYCKKEGE